MQKITPFLWFEKDAEEALELYAKVFPDAKITEKRYFPDSVPGLGGQFLTATIELFGQRFAVLNGRPENISFTDSVSFMVSCESQEEVDSYWDQLTADGGQETQCGWLKDKFGVSWQIVPSVMDTYLSDPDPEKVGRTVQAMMKMVKLDIAELKAAYEG
jgi:predicted 3-demethylubiquinone-9 3-methyltransferase (glyoxalase superfamily)